MAVEATKNWVGKTSSNKLYIKDILNLTSSFSWLKKEHYLWCLAAILETDGHMTNSTKNNLLKESNWLWLQALQCKDYPSAVGHVINFA